MKYLIAGLGNVGVEYELTRHNIGFLILDRLAEQTRASFHLDKLAYTTEVRYNGRLLHLIKPNTYMNLSGKAVNYWKNHHEIPLEKLLVITDDIALPYGKMRIRPKGSAGGHNGLSSIEQMAGGQNYPRLRFGVGNHFRRGKQADYVLSNFNGEEIKNLVSYIDRAIDAIHAFCSIGIQHTMNHFN